MRMAHAGDGGRVPLSIRMVEDMLGRFGKDPSIDNLNPVLTNALAIAGLCLDLNDIVRFQERQILEYADHTLRLKNLVAELEEQAGRLPEYEES